MGDYLMNTYRRLPLTFAKGEGVLLYDAEGKPYLDLTSGVGVNCLGHNHPAVVKAVAEQAGKIFHASNYYQTDVGLAFAEKLVKTCTGMKKVFLCNSGAEANEGACKIARKYSLMKYGAGRHTIVTLKGSFHGRTITMVSATGQEKFHRDFGPFTEGFVFIEPGNLETLEKALDQKTVAGLFIEAVQGESGIRPQEEAFIKGAAKLCAERDILLMFDEVQCGMGRTGSFLAFEQYGVNADIVTLAKPIAGGIPAGAVLAAEKAAAVLQPGDHGSTFGANALACAAGIAVLDIVAKPDFLKEIARKGKKIKSAVESWNHPQIKEIRGRGLMVGIDLAIEAWPVLEKAAALEKKGLLVLSGGPNTVRFLPPYIISDEEIEEALDLFKRVITI
jgi:acetylornithine/N-succinyldiaminopimelate aminotransferase